MTTHGGTMERYEYGSEAQLIRLRTEFERKQHEDRMEFSRRLHDLEMQLIRSTRLDPVPYLMVLLLAVLISAALIK
jgi:hypothetical protein